MPLYCAHLQKLHTFAKHLAYIVYLKKTNDTFPYKQYTLTDYEDTLH
jgi:hypothetical protein